MTSSSDRSDQPERRRPSFAERVAMETTPRPGHAGAAPLLRRAADAGRADPGPSSFTAAAGASPAADRQAEAGADGFGALPMADANASAPRTPYSRFIPREEIDKFSAWKPSALGGERRQAPLQAAPDPAALQRAAEAAQRREAELAAQRAEAEIAARVAEIKGARDGGYQDGYRDGLAAMEAFKQSFSAQASAQVASVVKTLDAQLAELEQHLAARVAGIALEVARQVVRSELTAQPEMVVAVTQEALAAILVSARHITVRLNPEDHHLVVQGLSEVLKARGARLVADALIQRGGCLVESDIGVVDARVATRWQRASAATGHPSELAQEAETSPAESLLTEPAPAAQAKPAETARAAAAPSQEHDA